MDYRKNFYFAALLPVSNDVWILADDQLSGISYTPGSADAGLIQENDGFFVYAGNNPIRCLWIFFSNVGFDGA